MTTRQHARMWYLASLVAINYRGPHLGRHLATAVFVPALWLALVLVYQVIYPSWLSPLIAAAASMACAVTIFAGFVTLRATAAAAVAERARWQHR